MKMLAHLAAAAGAVAASVAWAQTPELFRDAEIVSRVHNARHSGFDEVLKMC